MSQILSVVWQISAVSFNLMAINQIPSHKIWKYLATFRKWGLENKMQSIYLL